MFYIGSNPENFGKTHTSPVFYMGPEVVGGLRFSEVAKYETREEAEAALEEIAPRTAIFYDLSIIEEKPVRRFQSWNNGFMKNNPAYDIMM